jgi:hypothetical protein
MGIENCVAFVTADTLGAGDRTLELDAGLPGSTNQNAKLDNTRMIAVAKSRVSFFMAASPQ